MREEQLEDFFGEHHLKVVKLILLRNEKGQSKGSGIVEFESLRDAEYAVNKLHGSDIERRQICIDYAKAGPSAKQGGGGGYQQRYQ